MMMRPLRDGVLVRPGVDRTAERVSAGGIVMPKTANVRQAAEGHVVAVGPKVTLVAPGDRVVIDDFRLSELDVDGEKLWLTKQDDLAGVRT